LPLDASLAEAANIASCQEVARRERRLFFVAATRVRSEVRVLVSGDPRSLLPSVGGAHRFLGASQIGRFIFLFGTIISMLSKAGGMDSQVFD
jgi:hypothetical protein